MEQEKEPLIYLASPYQHKDEKVRLDRVERVTVAAGKLMQLGYCVYSPIVHSHHIAVAVELPKGWDYWKKHDLVMLSRCQSLAVLQLDGWHNSVGIKGEMEFARNNSIPIMYLEEEFNYDGNTQIF